MSLQIEALSPIMWTIIIVVALVLIAAVVFTWKSSAMSTRKMVTIAMLTAVYVVLNFAGTVRLGWINISVASLPVIVGAMLYGPVGGLLVGLLGAFMGQLLTYGVTATTILWILPQAARGLVVEVVGGKRVHDRTDQDLQGSQTLLAVDDHACLDCS